MISTKPAAPPTIEIEDLSAAEPIKNEVQGKQDELQLNDLDFIESSPISERSQPISLPAALCDDKLLEEISQVPDKMGFKIGDVAEILGVKQYVLRYWESEFEILRPRKATNNQRMYTRKDVENALLIRKLLHRDRFSIEGARQALKELKNFVRKEKDFSMVVNRIDSVNEKILHLASDIRRIRQLLK